MIQCSKLRNNLIRTGGIPTLQLSDAFVKVCVDQQAPGDTQCVSPLESYEKVGLRLVKARVPQVRNKLSIVSTEYC